MTRKAMFVDSHCHLTFPELLGRLPEIRAEMQAAGVDRALCICTTLEEFDAVHALARSAATAEHPFNAGLMTEALVSQARAALNSRP